MLKGIAPLILVLLVLIIAGIGTSSYIIIKKSSNPTTTTTSTTTTSTTTSTTSTTTSTTTTIPANIRLETYSQNMSCGIVNFTLETPKAVMYNSRTKITLYYDGICPKDFELGYQHKVLIARFFLRNEEGLKTSNNVNFEYSSKSGKVEGLLNVTGKGYYRICAGIYYCCGGFWPAQYYINLVSESNICNSVLSTTCFDSDGKDYYTRGTVDAVFGDVVIRQSDRCESKTIVREYFCDAGHKSSENFICPNGCYNGACIRNETTTKTT